MPTSRLPLDIKNFLNEKIESVSHLEVLITLFNNQNHEWDAEKISKEMRSNTRSASSQLNSLANQGLLIITSTNKFKYGPSREEDNLKVKKLVELYKVMPVAIITCIFERPKDKLKDLSDAFKWTKE